VIGAALKFLAGWKGYALVAVICLAAGAAGGWEARDLYADRADGKRAEGRVKTVERIVYRERAADDITQRIGEESAARQVQIRTATRTIIEKVPVHVTAEADADCVVPVGFVRVHDAAATGDEARLSEPPGQPDDAASGIALSAVAETVTFNYGVARETRQQLIDLQGWVREQQALADAPLKP
jgi:hypothetical protein